MDLRYVTPWCVFILHTYYTIINGDDYRLSTTFAKGVEISVFGFIFCIPRSQSTFLLDYSYRVDALLLTNPATDRCVVC